MKGGFKGPVEEAPAGAWVRYGARPGQVFRVQGRAAKDGSIWTYGGAPDPKGQRQYHAIAAGTIVNEVASPQGGKQNG